MSDDVTSVTLASEEDARLYEVGINLADPPARRPFWRRGSVLVESVDIESGTIVVGRLGMVESILRWMRRKLLRHE